VSPSGKLAGVTSFRSGHSYANAGSFSTQSVIYEVATGKPVATLESFTVFKDGKQFEPEDRNFWGVTFADGRTFYATMGTKKETHLVRGDLRSWKLETMPADGTGSTRLLLPGAVSPTVVR
jgi:hypothetical protein